MRAFLILVILLCTSLQVNATAQYPDMIFYNGKEYFLHNNPLESYFEKYPNKKPQSGMISSALWRGYIAIFEIKNNQLLLKDIEIQVYDTSNEKEYKLTQVSVINKVFPNNEIVKIDWMTGLLVLPYGKIVNYVHMGYASTYENYILLEINKGNLIQARDFTGKQYEKFKEKQFQAFKKTDEYKQLKDDMKKEGSTDDSIEFFLQTYVIDYTSKILTE